MSIWNSDQLIRFMKIVREYIFYKDNSTIRFFLSFFKKPFHSLKYSPKLFQSFYKFRYEQINNNNNNNNNNNVLLVARISLTLSRHFFLSFIASSKSSGLHPVSSHSCWMYVHAGRPAFARPCVGIHNNTSLMSSSLLLQQCPACLVRLTWIVFVIGGRWLYSWCLVGCCRQDLFKIARSILV